MDSAQSLKTILGAECELTGELTLDHDAVIMGTFEGRLNVAGKLVLGRTSRIKGTVIAGSLHMGGKVEGDVVVREKLELMEGGLLVGQVFSPNMAVSSGGVIKGKVCIGPTAADAANRWMAERLPAATSQPAKPTPERTVEQSAATAPAEEATHREPVSTQTVPAAIKAVLERRQAVKPLKTAAEIAGDEQPKDESLEHAA